MNRSTRHYFKFNNYRISSEDGFHLIFGQHKAPDDSSTSANIKSEFECDELLSKQSQSVDKDHGTGVESLSVEPMTSLSSSRDLNEMLQADVLTSFGPTDQNVSAFSNAGGMSVSSIAVDAPPLVPNSFNSGELTFIAKFIFNVFLFPSK